MNSAVVLAAVAAAQSNGTIEGTIVDSITGRGIPGVSVTMFTRQAVRYEATTDGSGSFRIANVAPGSYQARIEKESYYSGPPGERAYVIGSALDVAQVRLTLTRDATIRGRIFDPQGEPAANVRVSISGLSAVTSEQGEYALKPVPPGAYQLIATPPVTGEPVQAIPTTSPRFIVRGGDIDGMDVRLQEAEVFRIGGVVLNESGEPVAEARVRLHPIEQSKPRVAAGFYMGRGSGSLGIRGPMRVAATHRQETKSDAGGRFEFAAVPGGDWQVTAQVAGSIDSPDFVNTMRSGAETVLLGRAAVDDVRVRLRTPFHMAGVNLGLSHVDGVDALNVPQPDGMLVHPGRYILTPRPEIGRYAEAILLDGRNVIGQQVDLVSASQRIEVIYREARGVVRGKVNGDAKLVLLVPQDLTGISTARLEPIERDGTFEITAVAPGNYSAVALSGVDAGRTSFFDAEMLRRMITLGTRVQVTQTSTAVLDLRPIPWLE